MEILSARVRLKSTRENRLFKCKVRFAKFYSHINISYCGVEGGKREGEGGGEVGEEEKAIGVEVTGGRSGEVKVLRVGDEGDGVS